MQQEDDRLVTALIECHENRLTMQAELDGPNSGSTYYSRFRLLHALKAAADECQRLRDEIRVRDNFRLEPPSLDVLVVP
jgi:hypothetical protein